MVVRSGTNGANIDGMTIRRPGGLLEEALTHAIIGAFFDVHRKLGFGFLEHVYQCAMEMELRKRKHAVVRECAVTICYDGVPIAQQRLDMIVDGRVVVEIKATERLHRDAARQLYNYLRATRLEVGLLLHFGRDPNFTRVIYENALKPSSS